MLAVVRQWVIAAGLAAARAAGAGAVLVPAAVAALPAWAVGEAVAADMEAAAVADLVEVCVAAVVAAGAAGDKNHEHR